DSERQCQGSALGRAAGCCGSMVDVSALERVRRRESTLSFETDVRKECLTALEGSFMPLQIIPVIMCGGAGTRLWPGSRESMPKQFVPFIGQGSTFQQVMRRVCDPALFARPMVVTHSEFRFVVAEQLRDCGIGADIVLEPVRRDSGPAVAVAALLAYKR